MSNYAKLKPYERQLIADADETIALRGDSDLLRDRLERAQRAAAEAVDMVEALDRQLADSSPELTIRKAALLGMFAGGLLGFAAAWVLGSLV